MKRCLVQILFIAIPERLCHKIVFDKMTMKRYQCANGNTLPAFLLINTGNDIICAAPNSDKQ